LELLRFLEAMARALVPPDGAIWEGRLPVAEGLIVIWEVPCPRSISSLTALYGYHPR